MDTLTFSFNAVSPILLMILLGMLLRRLGLFSLATADAVNRLCFSIFIPLNIFNQLHDADLKSAADPGFVLFGAGMILATLLLLCLIVPCFIKDGIERGEYIQGVFRGNVSLISVSLLTNLYGAEGIRMMSILLPITLILYNSLSTVELAFFIRNGEKLSLRRMLMSVVTNPFVIASVVGMLFALSPVTLPAFLSSTIKSVSSVGSPMALMAIGATIDLKSMVRGARRALSAAVLRQIVIPIAVLFVAVILGFHGGQLGSILCIVCTPTATVGYVLAKNMGGNGKLAAQILVFSTILSFVSMFVSIAVLRGLGLL